MTKKKTTYSLSVVFLALLVGIMMGALLTPRVNRRSIQQGQMNDRVSAILQLVETSYVDEIDYDSLTNQMMNSMLSTLDPHSCYLSPEAREKESEMMQGQFEGIGVTLHYLNDTVYANYVIPGSPAAIVGIRAGDRIMWVDTTLVSGTGLTKTPSGVVDLIRGPRFSKVTLQIQRNGEKKLQKYVVTRNVIHHASIPAAVMMDKTTGYIHVSHFAETTASEFHAALLQLKQEGMKHLILDLRNNGGGILESALQMADELLPKDDLIVYTQGAHDRRRNVYATKGGLFEEGKLTVLINEHSASASEVVSGAIQDNDRGTIVGHRSFGKGLVQRQFNLTDNSAILLTIARYYSPSGRCIQRPYDKGSDEYYSEYLTRVLSNYAMADSVLNVQDTSQAFLTKGGRKVYGGGGIQPDVTLPYLRDSNLIYFNQLIDKQVLETVLYAELFTRYEDIMKQYPNDEAFVKNFKIDDALWQRILTVADKKGLKRDVKCINKYGNEIRNRYKALMAMALYGDDAYYKISLPYDTEVQKAKKL